MLLLIVALLGLTVFTFVVTSRGAAEAVSGAGYKEYRLGDYTTWLRRHVGTGKNWARIRSCLADADVCRRLKEDDRDATPAKFLRGGLSPVESGCCKPPTACNFTYGGGTEWTKTSSFVTSAADPDCGAWSNDSDKLCYDCQSCKAGVVDALKQDWKRAAIVNIVFLVLLIVVYSVGCCAFRNSRRDNYAYCSGGGWKQQGGGYA